MGGKKGESKKDRAAAAEAERSAQKAKAEEDAMWEAAGDGKKGKGAARKDEAANKQAEAARRKAEAKALEEAELAMMKKAPKGKNTRPASGKLTQAQIAQNKAKQEKEEAARQAQLAEAQRRQVSEADYEKMVDVSNTNRQDDVIEARSVEAALSALSVGDEGPDERTATRRRKAAYEAYFERQLPLMKDEKPGLKLAQYKSMIFELWKKDPSNPENAAKK